MVNNVRGCYGKHCERLLWLQAKHGNDEGLKINWFLADENDI